MLLFVLQLIATSQGYQSQMAMLDGGPNNATLTYALLIVRYAFTRLDYGVASALGVLMFLVLGVLAVVQYRTVEQRGRHSDEDADRGILSRYDLKKPRTRSLLASCCSSSSSWYVDAVSDVRDLLQRAELNTEVNSFPPTFLPPHWHFETLREGWNYIELPLFCQKHARSSSRGNMVVTVVVLGLPSFSLSRMNIPYSKAIHYLFLADACSFRRRRTSCRISST